MHKAGTFLSLWGERILSHSSQKRKQRRHTRATLENKNAHKRPHKNDVSIGHFKTKLSSQREEKKCTDTQCIADKSTKPKLSDQLPSRKSPDLFRLHCTALWDVADAFPHCATFFVVVVDHLPSLPLSCSSQLQPAYLWGLGWRPREMGGGLLQLRWVHGDSLKWKSMFRAFIGNSNSVCFKIEVAQLSLSHGLVSITTNNTAPVRQTTRNLRYVIHCKCWPKEAYYI